MTIHTELAAVQQRMEERAKMLGKMDLPFKHADRLWRMQKRDYDKCKALRLRIEANNAD